MKPSKPELRYVWRATWEDVSEVVQSYDLARVGLKTQIHGNYLDSRTYKSPEAAQQALPAAKSRAFNRVHKSVPNFATWALEESK